MTEIRRCRWCRRALPEGSGRGRPRQFCSQRCRQWDWVARQRAHELELSDGELVIARTALDELHDQLYVLACAVADTDADLAATPSPSAPGAAPHARLAARSGPSAGHPRTPRTGTTTPRFVMTKYAWAGDGSGRSDGTSVVALEGVAGGPSRRVRVCLARQVCTWHSDARKHSVDANTRVRPGPRRATGPRDELSAEPLSRSAATAPGRDADNRRYVRILDTGADRPRSRLIRPSSLVNGACRSWCAGRAWRPGSGAPPFWSKGELSIRSERHD